MNGSDRGHKPSSSQRVPAVLAGLLGGGFVGFWVGVLFLRGLILFEPSVGGRGPYASIGAGILGICFGIVAALLGGLCGAAVGLKVTSVPTDPARSTAIPMLALSVISTILFFLTGLLWALNQRHHGQMLRSQDAYWAQKSEEQDRKDAELIDAWLAGEVLEIDSLCWVKDWVWSEKIPQIDDFKLLPLIDMIDRQDRNLAIQALEVELKNPQRSEEIRIACLKALFPLTHSVRWYVLEKLGPEAAFLMPALAELLDQGRDTERGWHLQFDGELLKTLERLGTTAAPVAPVLEVAIRRMEEEDSPPSGAPRSQILAHSDRILAAQRVLRAIRGDALPAGSSAP